MKRLVIFSAIVALSAGCDKGNNTEGNGKDSKLELYAGMTPFAEQGSATKFSAENRQIDEFGAVSCDL